MQENYFPNMSIGFFKKTANKKLNKYKGVVVLKGDSTTIKNKMEKVISNITLFFCFAKQ